MKWRQDKSIVAKLDDWLGVAAASTPSLGKPLNIHIDEISDHLSDKAVWVAGGFELLRASTQSSRLRGVDCTLCLVFHLNPDEAREVAGVDDPQTQWSPLLDTMTPPELEFIHARDRSRYEKYLQKFGRNIGTLPVGAIQAEVYVTDRRDQYGGEVERVRHIWVVATRSPVGI